MEFALHTVAGVVASGAVALFARRRGSLEPSGAWAALGVGTTIYVGGGPGWFMVLLAFFATSSALGRVGARRKARTKLEFSKGDTRDALQVLANGGVAMVAAAAFALTHEPALAAAFLGGLATANADTWATELGVLSRGEPLSVRTLRRVPRGTSGAVSLTGTAAATGGALLLGGVAAAFGEDFMLSTRTLLLSACVGGVTGAFADSWLGATLQAQHYCSRCESVTEGTVHHCGATTQAHSGIAWFGNDAVNLAATAVGAASAACLSSLL